MDRSFRQGMSWFIFSEVMFFAAFFGALFYARMIAVPWLGGASNNAMTHAVLWPDFVAQWPLVMTPGGAETTAMGPIGLPLYNTNDPAGVIGHRPYRPILPWSRITGRSSNSSCY